MNINIVVIARMNDRRKIMTIRGMPRPMESSIIRSLRCCDTKKRVRQRRIMRVGDFRAHLGGGDNDGRNPGNLVQPPIDNKCAGRRRDGETDDDLCR